MITHKSRVLLISPAHPPTDPRILLKIAPALARYYNVVCLLPRVEQPPLEQQSPAVCFVQLPQQKHLSVRLLLVHPVILWHIIRLRPAILHLFMPELLPIGLLCRLFGVRVVYEVQENLRLKFDRKTRNNHPAFQWFFGKVEQLARRFCYHVFTEDSYLETYTNLRLPFAVVHNFPDIPGLQIPGFWSHRPGVCRPQPIELAYLGVVSFDRGLGAMVRAMSLLKPRYPNAVLHLIGRCHFDWAALEAVPDFSSVRDNLIFHGHLPHAEALPTVARCRAGLALLQSVGDYPYSYPTKLFEYMALGLPVVVSDFPLYRAVVESAGCGFCVNPDDHHAIANALTTLITHPDEEARMGASGTRAVTERYTWATESEKLINLYQKIVL
jgi:glycosyltransferase involved in cell wall biosynthesis